jgi:hypothetical protein
VKNRRRFDDFLDQFEHYALRLAVTIILVSWVFGHLWHDLASTWPALEHLANYLWR